MGKRRTFTPEFKLQVVLDLLGGRESIPAFRNRRPELYAVEL